MPYTFTIDRGILRRRTNWERNTLPNPSPFPQMPPSGRCAPPSSRRFGGFRTPSPPASYFLQLQTPIPSCVSLKCEVAAKLCSTTMPRYSSRELSDRSCFSPCIVWHIRRCTQGKFGQWLSEIPTPAWPSLRLSCHRSPPCR